MEESVEVTRGTVSDLPALEDVWLAVHHHHAKTMPELAPYVDDAVSWRTRADLYTDLLAKPTTVLLLAHDAGSLVGYGLVHVMRASETWLADTWTTGPRVGEIESLAVVPSHRGRGIGTRLLDTLEETLAAHGIDDLIIGTLAGNTGARRLYERRGYRPTWLYVSRLSGRSD